MRVVDVLVGMQYGSEGKGSAVQYLLSKDHDYGATMRVGSTQAGHTIHHTPRGHEYARKFTMQVLPCGWVDPELVLYVGAGASIDRGLLLDEVANIRSATGEDIRGRLFIDSRVWEVTIVDVHKENVQQLSSYIGSTAHGCGASLIRKLWRSSDNSELIYWLKDNGFNVVDTIEHSQSYNLLIEGHQGAMLAQFTSPCYPYVTTRECTASGIISECGVSPKEVRDVIGVFRTLPIRVAGNSGYTCNKEITWDEVSDRAGMTVRETTTVTKRLRRIFEFGAIDFKHAIMVNKPTRLLMTFANYLTQCYGETDIEIMPEVSEFIKMINELSVPHAKVEAFNTGEKIEHWVECD